MEFYRYDNIDADFCEVRYRLIANKGYSSIVATKRGVEVDGVFMFKNKADNDDFFAVLARARNHYNRRFAGLPDGVIPIPLHFRYEPTCVTQHRRYKLCEGYLLIADRSDIS